MSDVKDFLDSMANDDVDSATEIFNDIMSSKVADAVATKRDEVSKSMFGHEDTPVDDTPSDDEPTD
jgi:hypothetical protein